MPPPGPKVDRMLSFEPMIRIVRSETAIFVDDGAEVCLPRSHLTRNELLAHQPSKSLHCDGIYLDGQGRDFLAYAKASTAYRGRW